MNPVPGSGLELKGAVPSATALTVWLSVNK